MTKTKEKMISKPRRKCLRPRENQIKREKITKIIACANITKRRFYITLVHARRTQILIATVMRKMIERHPSQLNYLRYWKPTLIVNDILQPRSVVL